MRRESIVAVFLLVLSTPLLHLATNSTFSESVPTATVSFDPLHIDQQIGDTFEINITVKNVTNLLGFSIILHFETSYLTFKEADANRSMLKAPSEKYDFSCTEGQVILELPFLQASWQPQNGSGTLVTLKFYCSNTGNDFLVFEPGAELGSGSWREWMLVDSDFKKIPYVASPTCRCIVTHIIRTVYLDYPQTYLLLEDVNYTAPTLFSVMSDDVVLDLNNHAVNNTHGAGGWGWAIKIQNHDNITIKNGNITNFQYAIEMKGCEQVWIFDLTILNMSETAMNVQNSNHIHILNNNVSGSLKESLLLSTCSFSEVSHNIFSNDEGYGMHIIDSTRNTISQNQIVHNEPGGIYMEDSSNNTIFNNNFINNTDSQGKTSHVLVEGKASFNIWNSKYPLGGNYWDDWNDTTRQPRITDYNSGENQTNPSGIPVSDGIGDTPYFVKGDTNDTYPLLNPFNTSGLCIFATPLTLQYMSRSERTSLIVAIFGDFAQVRNYTFNPKTREIVFDVDGGNFCNVIVPRGVLEGPFRVSIDNVTKAFTLYWDGTNTVAHIIHETQSHVEIITKLKGDINGDGQIRIDDITWLALNLGLQPNP